MILKVKCLHRSMPHSFIDHAILIHLHGVSRTLKTNRDADFAKRVVILMLIDAVTSFKEFLYISFSMPSCSMLCPASAARPLSRCHS